jgi:hypothetical protein
MPQEGFKDRIYNVEQETDEECEEKEAKKAEEGRVDGLCSTYNGLGRAYGDFIPGTRSEVEKTTS